MDQKSQGSVQYGSDAAGGTVNSFTKSSRFLDEPAGRGFGGGSAFYEYRTNGEGSSIGRLEVGAGIGGTFGALLGVSAKDYRIHGSGQNEAGLGGVVSVKMRW